MFTIFGNLLIILTLGLTISGCQKKSVNSISAKNDILYHLNRNNTKDALAIIETEKKIRPNDPELAIYEASVYTIEAGIDIYSIFPLLKLKFFREPIANWDSLDKYNNPYGDLFEGEGKPVKVADGADENKPLDSDLLSKDETLEAARTIKFQSYMMNGIWGLYESIPILILVPSVELSKEKFATKAKEILLNPNIDFNKSQLSEKRFQFLTLIDIIMFITYLKDTTDFSKIQSPNDLVCNTDPIKLANNYKPLRKYALDILTHMIDSGLIKNKDNSKEAIAKNEEKINSIKDAKKEIELQPEDLNINKKNKLSDELFTSQEKKCNQK